jgi:hypothetical protein
MSTNGVKTERRLTLLPVSGRRVVLQAPTGAEDLLLLEAPDDDLALALILMDRLARPVDVETGHDAGGPDWSHLTATDLDVCILRLRQSTLGDRVVSDVRCQAAGCGERIDISFGIDQYIGHHIPAHATFRGRGWGVEPAEEPGWLRLISAPTIRKGAPALADVASSSEANAVDKAGVLFRLPTIADLMTVAGLAGAAEELARRCIRPSLVSARQRRLIETAMGAIAPSLTHDLQGVCPECGAEVTVFFDPRRYCLRELRDRAAFVYQDIDVLARRYHWAESDILALPGIRRMNYAEAARQEGDRSA